MQVERRIRAGSPAAPFDAQGAVEHLLGRLCTASGATRVAVWAHDPAERTVVLLAGAACAAAEPADGGTDLPLTRSPFLAAVVRARRPVVARADGRRAADRELAARGIRSAHGEPLVLDGEVVGVLTIEPAAAVAPRLLRQVAPRLAAAVAEARNRQADQRRLELAGALLALIEAGADARTPEQLLSVACTRLEAIDGIGRAEVLLLRNGGLARGTTASPAPAVAETALYSGRVATQQADDGPWSLAVPIGRRPYRRGALLVTASGPDPLPDDLRRLLSAVGTHLAGALGQARAAHPHPASV